MQYKFAVGFCLRSWSPTLASTLITWYP